MHEHRAADEQCERQRALEHVEEARRALRAALEASEQSERLSLCLFLHPMQHDRIYDYVNYMSRTVQLLGDSD